MNIFKLGVVAFAFLLAAVAAPAFAAGKLEIRDAWIRSAPPNATMLAGYATLHNTGDAPITINTVKAQGFDDTSLHETVLVGDVSQMRSIGKLTIAPDDSVNFAPGGKHIMLMQPAKAPQPGDHVTITFGIVGGGDQSADFVIRDAAPGDETAAPVTHKH